MSYHNTSGYSSPAPSGGGSMMSTPSAAPSTGASTTTVTPASQPATTTTIRRGDRIGTSTRIRRNPNQRPNVRRTAGLTDRIVQSSRLVPRTCQLKVKGVNVCDLNKVQQAQLRTHQSHHTKKHIESMVDHMKKGWNFNTSHYIAMQTVGK
tara:strand:+ start:740 stop:1192 length:453 start_codon:yes stop_codon:yes gene_type:complete